LEDQQQKKYQLMTETPVSRLIPRMALPCVVSMLVTAFYNMADTFFVGMLKSNAATGAVGVVFSLMAIIQAIGFFFRAAVILSPGRLATKTIRRHRKWPPPAFSARWLPAY
jgi:Na+-driven multidrug efflux pump